MKKLHILLLLFLVSAFLLFSGCGKDKDDDRGGISGIPDISSTNYDWDIVIVDFSAFDGETSGYRIWADWLGESSAISEDDAFTLDINGVSHELWGSLLLGSWSFNTIAEMEPGTSYNLVFRKNGSKVASKAVRTPYRASVSFPTSFDPSQSATMNWQMSADNKIQHVEIYSDFGDDNEDDWGEAISASARSYTFPANRIAGSGPDAQYGMILGEMNFEKTGRVAFSSMFLNSKIYGEGAPAKPGASEMYEIARTLRQRM